MKKVVLFNLALVLGLITSSGQNNKCDCKADLDFIIEKLKVTPSYKRQIKGQKEIQFNKTYASIVSKINYNTTVEECFKFLAKQITVIEDFHINLYANTKYFKKSDMDDDEKLNDFLQSNTFKLHPKSTLNLDSLRDQLTMSIKEGIEGIYILGTTTIEIGILKMDDNTYQGIVLASDHPLWTRGQIFLYVYKNKFDKYNIIQHDIYSRHLKMFNSITYENGRLLNLKKNGFHNNFEFKTDKTCNWELKTINDFVQYIYMGNFNRSSANREQADLFLNKLKDELNAPNIIVDLRSNSGGASKVSQAFFKLLRKSKAQLFIITNSFTISNGEQFTVKLKNLDNSKHLGQTTYGALAYGSNYGKLHQTPSGHFSFYPTDMDFHNEYYKYEGYGIIPDVKLGFNSDWIEQTLAIIYESK
jgi:hypothetical protein